MQHCGFSDQSRLAKRHFSSFLWIDNSSYIPTIRSLSLFPNHSSFLSLSLYLFRARALAPLRAHTQSFATHSRDNHPPFTQVPRTYFTYSHPPRFAFK